MLQGSPDSQPADAAFHSALSNSPTVMTTSLPSTTAPVTPSTPITYLPLLKTFLPPSLMVTFEAATPIRGMLTNATEPTGTWKEEDVCQSR